MNRKLLWTLILTALLAFGCGEDSKDPDNTPGDTGMTADTSMTEDTGMMEDTNMMVEGDNNDTIDEAVPLTVGGNPNADTILAGDQDFFSFEATAGEWYIISTTANPEDELDKLDTVITLYNPAKAAIAENDDSQPRTNTDSELIFRATETGTHYVMVQEFTQWMGETLEGGEDFAYQLQVANLDVEASLVNLDGEAGNDAASAQALGWNDNDNFNIIIGDFTDGADVDVFAFSMFEANPNLTINYMPTGAQGNGSTVTSPTVWITNADGSEVIASINASQLDEISPSLPSGDYLLWISENSAGANDFYVLKSFRSEDNPVEVEPNDDAASATVLTFDPVQGSSARRAFLLSNIGEGDTDLYSFEAVAGEPLSVFCSSKESGSGVNGLQAQILDSEGAPVSPAILAAEDPIEALQIDEVSLPGAGTYILSLTKQGQDAEVMGDWVRCGVVLGTLQ